MNAHDTEPFRKNASYRVKKSFSSLDDFAAGEVLRYAGSVYSRYDGMYGFNFTDAKGKNRRWDCPEEEPPGICRDLFEEIA